jgi:hypothetical protein
MRLSALIHRMSEDQAHARSSRVASERVADSAEDATLESGSGMVASAAASRKRGRQDIDDQLEGWYIVALLLFRMLLPWSLLLLLLFAAMMHSHAHACMLWRECVSICCMLEMWCGCEVNTALLFLYVANLFSCHCGRCGIDPLAAGWQPNVMTAIMHECARRRCPTLRDKRCAFSRACDTVKCAVCNRGCCPDRV